MKNLSLDSVFPGSLRYRSLDFLTRATRTPLTARESLSEGPSGFTERHLQCIWYDQKLRPGIIEDNAGQPIEIVSAGRWNLEAGPDFIDATLSVGKSQTVIKGDVEVHISPDDWTRHSHGSNPAYSKVVLHLCLKPGERPATLPSGAIQVELLSRIRRDGIVHPEDIDTAAYPYSALLPPETACAKVFPLLDHNQQLLILSAAGEERLRLKSKRMRRLIEERGPTQCLYEEIMAALGYKNNRRPFRQLAALLPFEQLHSVAQGDPITAYALLLGKSGLLQNSLGNEADDESNRFLRQLWDLWWRNESTLPYPGKTVSGWQMSGVRPQNHPVRRLAAAACIFSRERPPTEILEFEDRIPYWTHRLAVGSRVQDKAVKLLGEDRKSAIIANIIVPYLAARNESISDILSGLPSQGFNSITREMMNALMGGDYNPALYRQAIVQQGLIQVFTDYCLDKNNTCRNCAFAAAIAELRQDNNPKGV